MPSIEREIESINKENPKLGNLKHPDLFSLVCYKYFYNNGEISYKDYLDAYVNGTDDGGIDLIKVIEDSNDEPMLALIQCKDITALENTQDIIAMLKQIDQTYNNFKNGKTAGYSKKLKRVLGDKLAEVEGYNNIVSLAIFLNTQLTDQQQENINKKIDDEEFLSPYTVYIFDKNFIERKIENILDPKRWVDEGKIKIAKEQGKVLYGSNGILVNIYASSLKNLYERYSDRGLFEQNFRYFVKNKKIDNNIKKSLQDKREEFWFLNNGIIIGCNDFKIDGDNIKLYRFSIINGCQTTTLIGDYKGINEGVDFLIPCKIVKPKEEESNNEGKFQHFISMIAESSNSQKPISDRDLKANMPEQRKLQIDLKREDPKIYFHIKRGEDRKSGLESWQNINNDLFGQLILSFNFQQPGTARSFKKKIFSEEKIYNKVFKREIDKANIVDILKLDDFYQNFFLTKMKETSDEVLQSVAMNGRFIILSVVGFLIKFYRKILNTKISRLSDEWVLEIQKDNIKDKGLFKFYLPDNYEIILHALYYEIISEIADIYNRGSNKYKTVSNFFKADSYYQEIILNHLINRYENNECKRKEIEDYVKQIFEI